MVQALTPGSIAAMIQTVDPAQAVPDPICQVLSVKKITATSATAQDRWRIILSDGQHFAQGESARASSEMMRSRSTLKHVGARLSHVGIANEASRR